MKHSPDIRMGFPRRRSSFGSLHSYFYPVEDTRSPMLYGNVDD
jgi:hypothetical protein